MLSVICVGQCSSSDCEAMKTDQALSTRAQLGLTWPSRLKYAAQRPLRSTETVHTLDLRNSASNNYALHGFWYQDPPMRVSKNRGINMNPKVGLLLRGHPPDRKPQFVETAIRVYIYMYIDIHIYVSMYIYIYIYIYTCRNSQISGLWALWALQGPTQMGR